MSDMDKLKAVLEQIVATNASKHGTTGMMVERCVSLARDALALLSRQASPQTVQEPVATTLHPDRGVLRLSLDDWKRLGALPVGTKLYASPLPQAAQPEEQSEELAAMTRMFHAACADLGQINEALGLDPDDGGSEPILDAIEELKAKAAQSALSSREQIKDGAVDAEDARQFKPRALVTMNGKQLKDLLDYAWPDKDDADQADSELTLIAHDTPFKSTEGDDMPAGLYCYCTEYPEEGIILIDEKDAAK
jgi:hypothetical protein